MGITPQQYQAMTERIGGRRRSPEPLLANAAVSPSPCPDLVMGIDPSLRGTGFGIIRFNKAQPTAIAYGTIACPPIWPRSRCLVHIAQNLRQAIKSHRPTVCAIEGLFYAQNLGTALIMGEARGVCLLAAAEAGMTIYEIAARKMKQAIVGYGAAQKIAVAKMVQRQLRMVEAPAPDAADALALALAYAHTCRHQTLSPLKSL